MKTFIKPLGISFIDWEIYSEVCKESIGKDPIKILSTLSKNIKDKNSFLGTLNFNDTVELSLNNIENQQHVFINFIGVTHLKVLGEIALTNDLYIKRQVASGEYYLFILSGTLKQWNEAIIKSCSENTMKIHRQLFNTCYENLRAIGFKKYLKRVDLEDGTYILN